MSAQANHTVWTAYLSDTAGTVPAGKVLCLTLDGHKYVISTLTNRTDNARRSAGVAITPGDIDNPAVELQFVGVVPTSISGLGAGTATSLVVDDNGLLARLVGDPDGLQIVGNCDADGVAYVDFAGAGDVIAAGNGAALNQEAANAALERTTVPLGYYDPRHYGAVLDGVTDDLPALQAMLADMPDTGAAIHWPVGLAWVSDTWIVNKPIFIRGTGGNDGRASGLSVAPGVTGLELRSNALTGGGVNGAGYSQVSDFSIESRILVAPNTSRGTGLVMVLKTMNPTYEVISNGDVRVRPSNAAPLVCFRATTPTTAAVVTDGSVPAGWSNTIGSTTTDSFGITWTTESVPSVRANLTGYVVGQRVFALNDNRYVFTCSVAGTSGASAPADMTAGVYGKESTGVQVRGTVTDGGVTWAVSLMGGIYCNAPQCRFDRLYGYKLTTYFLHIQAGTDDDALGSGDANNVRIRDIYGSNCGGVLALVGSDVNAYRVDGVDGIFCGVYHPSATTFLTEGGTLPYPDGGRGGHILFERSQAGGFVSAAYGQDSTGLAIIKNGTGHSTFIGCGDEIGPRPYFTGGPSFLMGNIQTPDIDTGSTQVICVDPNFGRGIEEVSREQGADLHIALQRLDGFRMYVLNRLNDGASGGFAYCHDTAGNQAPIGYWTYQWFDIFGGVRQNAYTLSTPLVTLDPGPGWLSFQQGFFHGLPSASGAVFRGHTDALKAKQLRHGLRKTGDEFVTGAKTYVYTSDGYRAVPWQHDTVVRGVAASAYGSAGDMCEPTANTGTPFGGEKVFRCTAITTGLVDVSEPDWSTAVSVSDTVTDGGVTWTLIGFTPSFAVWDKNQNEFSSEAKPGRAFSDWDTVSTTDDTPANVLEISVPAAIYGDCTIVVHVEVTISFIDSGNTVGGSLSKKAAFTRTGGTLTLLAVTDLDDATLYTGPATGDFDVTALDNDTIQVPVTGIADTDINWTASAHLQIALAPPVIT